MSLQPLWNSYLVFPLNPPTNLTTNKETTMPTNAPSYTSSKKTQSERAEVGILAGGANRGAL